MPENTTYNNECPVCRQNFLTVVEDESTVRGACQACGHTFSEWKTQETPPQENVPEEYAQAYQEPPIGNPESSLSSAVVTSDREFSGGFIGVLDTLGRFSGVISIVAIVLIAIFAFSISGSVGDIDNRVDTIKNSFDDKIETAMSNINTIENRVTANDNDIDTMEDDIDILKAETSDLNNIRDKINGLDADRDFLLANFTALEGIFYDVNDTVTDMSNSMGLLTGTDVNVTMYYDSNDTNPVNRECTIYN
jgi:hypothetical protein